VATLNIKNFPDGLYERLRKLAEREHRSIAQQAIHVLNGVLGPHKKLSILGLEGLGKDLWEDTDASEYVGRERDSWD